LDAFFKPVTAEVAAADRAQMTLEWRENREMSKAGDDAHAAQAKRQKREEATQRQHECRSRKVAGQIRSGKRDMNGMIIRTEVRGHS
jgi:hypothetical protein